MSAYGKRLRKEKKLLPWMAAFCYWRDLIALCTPEVGMTVEKDVAFVDEDRFAE